MKIQEFEATITVQSLNDDNNLKNISSLFGFNDCYCIDSVDNTFECYAKDGLFDIIKSRTCFLLKRIQESAGIYKIIGYNIKAIIVDSYKNDEMFRINN